VANSLRRWRAGAAGAVEGTKFGARLRDERSGAPCRYRGLIRGSTSSQSGARDPHLPRTDHPAWLRTLRLRLRRTQTTRERTRSADLRLLAMARLVPRGFASLESRAARSTSNRGMDELIEATVGTERPSLPPASAPVSPRWQGRAGLSRLSGPRARRAWQTNHRAEELHLGSVDRSGRARNGDRSRSRSTASSNEGSRPMIRTDGRGRR
jgi:hypothetical protein